VPDGLPQDSVVDGETFRLDTLGSCIKPGTLIEVIGGVVYPENYGPIMLLFWAKGFQSRSLSLNMAAEEACRVYTQRFGSRRFSRIRKVGASICIHRIFPILNASLVCFIAACLASIWIIYLGSICMKERWISIIHRGDRCDLSLFQLGLRLL